MNHTSYDSNVKQLYLMDAMNFFLIDISWSVYNDRPSVWVHLNNDWGIQIHITYESSPGPPDLFEIFPVLTSWGDMGFNKPYKYLREVGIIWVKL